MHDPQGRAWLVRLGLVLVAAVLTGCAVLPYQPQAPAQGLLDVRFWPQQAYQCGPAALAMALDASDVQVTPETLVDAVYLPARRGSLQAEMLAAPRRYERIAYRIPPRYEALEHMLEAELPVVVLLNLGVAWWPVWHYAVVIGATQQSVWLHSGQRAQVAMRRSAFERHWQAAQNWAMVVASPEQIPPRLEPVQLVHTLAQLEAQFPKLAQRAYAAALGRWPANQVLRFGLANSYRAQHQWLVALPILRELYQQNPTSAPIVNNLALTLWQVGEVGQALEVLRPVLARLPAAAPWRQRLEHTWYLVQGSVAPTQ